MRIRLILGSLFAALFLSTPLSAQEGPQVLRTWNCSVNNGYTMSEVVEFARNAERSADVSPTVRFFREAVAVPGDYQRDYDFQVADYYASWDDYVQTRGAQRNQPSGRSGTLRLRDMISCDPKRNVFNVFQGNTGDIFDGTETTLMGVQYCRGNGATTADAVNRAVQLGQSIGVNTGVDQLLFGGPSNDGQNVGIRFATRFVFPNISSFAERMDDMRESSANGTGPAYSGNIICGTGGLWASHRIFQEN